MSKIVDLIDKTKRYFRFNLEEIKSFVITAIIISFMFSFNEWGTAKFDIPSGISNWALALVIVAISLFVHIAIQMLAGLNIGYRVEYKMWLPGLLVGLVLTIISKGSLWWLIFPGGIFLHHLAHHRLGFFRYGINTWSQSMICLWGILATVFLTLVFKILLGIFPGNIILQKFLIFNIVLAFITALPIPPLDGSRIFFGTRGVYLFVLGAVVGWCLLIYFASLAMAVIGSLLLGIVATVLFFIFVESGYIKK